MDRSLEVSMRRVCVLGVLAIAGALSLTVACSDKATNGDDSEAGKPYVLPEVMEGRGRPSTKTVTLTA